MSATRVLLLAAPGAHSDVGAVAFRVDVEGRALARPEGRRRAAHPGAPSLALEPARGASACVTSIVCREQRPRTAHVVV
eukprot:CAMPEP_0183386326 /NCGR_PEP_ID=MMETSP0370-20130417/2224_1 /TAXON_ID=268820 /ORGANISM="Peridinium aciculiferum, Strain PAER-2" /LENGTH=78 /DNA_ID=CAMNT_0025564585 /DNA_START=270 /DNA_END=503 /DNA_ORIENTATION=+